MKLVIPTLCVALIGVGCQKSLAPKEDAAIATVASDANSPINCHSISFTSDYPVKPGEVPPFSFTKTLYPDARVKTIKVLSRKNPIHPAFKKEAVEFIGTFTYAANPMNPYRPHLAYLKGTSEVWEYYKTPGGAGAKRSVSKKNVNWKFVFTAQGFCTEVVDLDITYPDGGPAEHSSLNVSYQYEHPELIDIIYGDAGYFYPYQDQYGNITDFYFPYGESDSWFRVKYDYAAPRGNKTFNYIPSQNLICQEYSLLEVMQWLPQSSHARKSAGGTFKVNGVKTYQDQIYKNYQFDAKGNQTSVTYGDNILQKTFWSCQN